MKKKKNKKEIKDKIEKSKFVPLFYSLLTTLIIVALIIVVGTLIDLPRRGPGFIGQSFIGTSIIINSISFVILLILLTNYFSIYTKTKSTFSLGLIAMVTALLLNSITSNPLILIIFGFWEPIGLFGLTSNVFTLVASIVLLYISRE